MLLLDEVRGVGDGKNKQHRDVYMSGQRLDSPLDSGLGPVGEMPYLGPINLKIATFVDRRRRVWTTRRT